MSERPSDLHLKLAGIIRIGLGGGRGPADAYVFDPHRLALPAWAYVQAAQPLQVAEAPALLVTLDRHFDLVPPRAPHAIPQLAQGLAAIDAYARWELDVRNYDHILAAMEAGVVGDAILIARSSPRGALEAAVYTDTRGRGHQLLRFRTVDQAAESFARKESIADLIQSASRVLLDVDLDCFTSLSDADPTLVIPWPQPVIREFLLPDGSAAFWEALLLRCVALTLAREPPHCGGLLASGDLFQKAVEVLIGELLGAQLP